MIMGALIPDDPVMVGGGFVAALLSMALLISKFRAIWNRDASDAAASGAQVAVIDMLRQENERLHTQVMALQGEVAKLQQLVAELTTKLTRFEISHDQQAHLDRLGREGKLERRKGGFHG